MGCTFGRIEPLADFLVEKVHGNTLDLDQQVFEASGVRVSFEFDKVQISPFTIGPYALDCRHLSLPIYYRP